MSVIQTRLATVADRAALIGFIRDHWSASHVFVHAPEVFDWQYGQADGRLNMVLAEQDGAILGVLGFIPMGRFDPALGDEDCLLALWKVRDDLAPPGLGLRLLKFIQSQLKPRLIGAIGISDMVGPIYRALGYSLDRLHQAAIFNPAARGATRIASGVPEAAFAGGGDAGGYRIDRLTDSDAAAIEALAQAGVPRKSFAYVRDRYLNHPFYRYTCAVIRAGDRVDALAVWRAVTCNGATILRIVDIIGGTDWLAHGRALLLPQVQAAGAEYIDLMQMGTPDEVLRAGGWISPDWAEGLILPNYFAPFEPRNITVALAWKPFGGDRGAVRFYRADSDQDRPNQAPVAQETA